jgi:probable HAF family extracellular repeat protein
MSGTGTTLRIAFAVLLLTLIPNCYAQFYSITDLGTLPGDTASMAWGMNLSAKVVGASEGSGIHGFLWTKENGLLDFGCGQSFASAINTGGRVVGSCGPTSMNETAFLWTEAEGLENLGALPGGSSSSANALNDATQVVGTSATGGVPAGNYLHAFLWTKSGGLEDLGTLPGGTFSLGNGINDAAQVVGYAGVDAEFDYHAFVWTKSGGMVDLGTLPGGTHSNAIAINAAGQIVGSSDSIKSSPNVRAVFWTEAGKIRDLGKLPGANYSFAASINDAGQIVGESGPQGTDASHAAIWDQNHQIGDLNNAICPNTGWVLLSARAINALGEIAGYGTINGQTHAFLAKPIEDCK